MERARYRCRLAVGDERCQLGSPALKFLSYAGPSGHGAGEVNTVNPLFWLP